MSDYKALFKHSRNYLFATIATKALAFVSLPVYTRLLTVEEFGVYNIFISTVGIFTVLLTLNTEVAISRYYYDAKDENDFKRFVGTSSLLTTSVFLLMSGLFVIFCKQIALYLDFEVPLTLAIIPVSLYYVLNSVFQQIYQPLLQSKKIAIVSSVQTYLAFALSVVVILFLDDKKYYGQVIGTILAMFILGGYMIGQVKNYFYPCFERKHIQYILSYSLPYLPYSLSGVIIAQFGKIIIGQSGGFEDAGIYSFASNIAMLMMILISVVHSAWNPYYFQYMNDKDYGSIDKDYDLIWRCTLFCGGALSLFCYELGMILGKSDYLTGLYVIPILVVGYFFYQWSYVYMRNTGYAKKTIWNAVAVILSGIVNVVLNSLVIGSYGALGVAFSFMVSYLIMLIIGWIINRTVIKEYATPVKSFLVPLLITLPFLFISITIELSNTSILIGILIKTVSCLLLAIILFYKYSTTLFTYIKRE